MRQAREYSLVITSQQETEGRKKMVLCYTDTNMKRPFTAGSRQLQHFDTGSFTKEHMKLLDPRVQQHLINYA